MAGLTPKNLMVDAEQIRDLARQRGVGESQAIRQAIDFALVAEEVMAAIRGLHERDGLDDVFRRLPDSAN